MVEIDCGQALLMMARVIIDIKISFKLWPNPLKFGILFPNLGNWEKLGVMSSDVCHVNVLGKTL